MGQLAGAAPVSVLGKAFGFVGDVFRLTGVSWLINEVLGELWAAPEPPAPLKQGAQLRSSSLRQNQAQLDDVKSYIVGRVTKCYPSYCAMPYKFYRDQEEYLCVVVHLHAGPCVVYAVAIADTPATTLGARVEIAQPAQRLTLLSAIDVYTAPDVTSQALDGGAMRGNTLTASFAFGAGGANRIEVRGGNSALGGIEAGTSITISGGSSNDGARTMTSSGVIRGRFMVPVGSYVIVDGAALTVETATASIAYTYSVDLDEIEVVQVADEDENGDPVRWTFNAALSQVTGPDDILDKFRNYDLVRWDGTAHNDGQDYLLLDLINGNGAVLDQPPVDEVDVQARMFLQRRFVGPFYASTPGTKVHRIEIDLGFDALGEADDDSSKVFTRTVDFLMAWRPCDDAGQPLAGWTYEPFSQGDKKLEPRRWTYGWDFDEPISRPQVKLARVRPASDNSRIRDTATWTGLRGYITPRDGDDPAMDARSARLALQVRSTGQISRQTESKINVDIAGLYPVLVDGEWVEQETLNPAWLSMWWMIEAGEGKFSHASFDLAAFVMRAAQWDAADVTFSAEFDKELSALEGAKTILQVARAEVQLDPLTGLYTLYVDEPAAPMLLLVDGVNCSITEDRIETPTANSYTGVEVSFTDRAMWQTRPGPVAGDSRALEKFTLIGETRWDASWRFANYRYRHNKLRTHYMGVDTEMEGLLVRRGMRVLLASAEGRYGMGGEVAAAMGNVLWVMPAPRWTPGVQHYVWLQTDTGEPAERIACSRGASDEVLVLASAPTVVPRVGSGFRTVFAFGHDGDDELDADAPKLMICESRTANGLRNTSLQLRNEDLRVHEDPGPAPIDRYESEAASPAALVPSATLSSSGAQMTLVWEPATSGPSVPESLIYEASWQYKGALQWTPVYRGGTQLQATWPVSASGVVVARVRALAADVIGPYTESNEITLGGAGGALVAFVSPPALYGSGGTIEVDTDGEATVTVSGGEPPYEFDWSVSMVSGPAVIHPRAPHAQSTRFGASFYSPQQVSQGAAGCVVRDSVGAEVTAIGVSSVRVSRTGTRPPGPEA